MVFVPSETDAIWPRRVAEIPWRSKAVRGMECGPACRASRRGPFPLSVAAPSRRRSPPPCALPAAGRFPAAFVRTAAFRGATAGVDFLGPLLRAARFRLGLAAAQRLFVAAMIGISPYGDQAAFLPGGLRRHRRRRGVYNCRYPKSRKTREADRSRRTPRYHAALIRLTWM
jgi:hypothetical protein